MNTSHFYRCVIAVPPQGKRDWNARIMRGGRVVWSGVWRTRRAAVNAWLGFALAGGGLRDDCIGAPIFTTQQRAKPIKRRKR